MRKKKKLLRMVPTSSRSAIASAVTNQTVHQPLIVQPPRHRRRLIRHRRDCQGGKQRRRSTVSTQSSLATTLTNQKPVRMTINGDDINNGNDHIMTNSNKHATHMTDETTESTNTSARTTKATKIPISLRKSRREKKRALTEKEWSADSESQNPSQATVTGPAPSGTQSLSASDLANYLVDEGTRLFNDILKPSGWTWQYTSRTLSGYAIVAPGVKVTGAQEGITLFTSFMALGEQYNKDGKNSIDIVTRATKALVKSGAIPSKFKPEKADRMDMKLGNKSEPSQDSKSQSTKIKDRHESSKSLRNCNSSEINEKQSEMVREPATKKLRAIETSEYDPNRFCNSHERRQTSDIAKNDQHRPTQSLSFTSNQSNKLNKHRVAADDTNLNTKMPATTKHRSGPTREYLGSTGNDNQKVLQGTSDVATEDTIENSCSLTHGEVYIIPNTIHKIESSERRAQESVQRSTLERGFIHNASDEEVPGNRETKVVPIMEINPDKSLCSAEPLAVQCQDLGASHLICRLSDDEPKRITETIVVESITTQSEDTTNSAIPPQKLSQDSTAEAEEQAMLKDSDNFCMKNSSVEFASSVSLPDLAKYTKNGHDPSQQDNARTGSRGLVEKEPRSQRRKKYPESWLSTVANREESRIRTTRDHLYRDKERNIVHRPQGYHTNNTVGFAVRKGVKRGVRLRPDKRCGFTKSPNPL